MTFDNLFSANQCSYIQYDGFQSVIQSNFYFMYERLLPQLLDMFMLITSSILTLLFSKCSFRTLGNAPFFPGVSQYMQNYTSFKSLEYVLRKDLLSSVL